MDTVRGPVVIYLFPGNPNLPDVTLPTIQLPESSTYYVPENRTTIPTQIKRKTKVLVPKDGVDVSASFARSYEEYLPRRWNKHPWMFHVNDVWIILPRDPERDAERYNETHYVQGEYIVVEQEFNVHDAFANDTSLYQFDLTVRSGQSENRMAGAMLYRISLPFLLRRERYDQAYIGCLPCSPYRRDADTDSFVKDVGWVAGNIPCARYVTVGLRDPAAVPSLMLHKLGSQPGERVDFTAAFAWRPQSLDDFREQYYVIHPAELSQALYDEERPSMSISVETAYERRHTSLKFLQYIPIQFTYHPDQVTNESVRRRSPFFFFILESRCRVFSNYLFSLELLLKGYFMRFCPEVGYLL